MPRQDPSAELARRYIAATLGIPEDEVEQWDTGGRQGAYDLRYKHHGRAVAVEAKSVVDYDFRLMGARIGRSPYTAEPRLDRLWIVDLRHGAEVQAARSGLPDILAQVEARGWYDQLAYRAARWAGLAEDLDRLDVTGMWSQPPTEKHPAGFVLHPEPVGAWEAAIPDLSTFVSSLLGDTGSQLVQDLRRQLGAAQDADERHAFLLVGWEHVEGWQLMQWARRDLPSQPPRVPGPIDGVWLATFAADTRVVAWLPGAGWVEGRDRP